MIPCLNRDGDLLSDLVLPLFGSIAGAESVLLALDDELRTTVAMAEAPHGTAPALQGKDVANPMGMILAAAALLHHAGEAGADGAERRSRAVYEAVFGATAAGVRTPDLGGHAGTTEFTDEVISRVRAKLWPERDADWLGRRRPPAPAPTRRHWAILPSRITNEVLATLPRPGRRPRSGALREPERRGRELARRCRRGPGARRRAATR